jgi:cytoskeletal protein CcmA (bactofilin family)
MFNGKTKSDTLGEETVSASASLIGAGTTMKGDITSNGDLRIDGSLVGNIHCSAKVVIGANGNVQGDISGQTADIMGKVTGTIKVKDLLLLKGGSTLNGNIQAAKLQIEPTANFNGECHMTPAVVAGNGVAAGKSGADVKGDAKREFKHTESAIAPA